MRENTKPQVIVVENERMYASLVENKWEFKQDWAKRRFARVKKMYIVSEVGSDVKCTTKSWVDACGNDVVPNMLIKHGMNEGKQVESINAQELKEPK